MEIFTVRHWADAINSYLGAEGFKAPTGLAALNVWLLA